MNSAICFWEKRTNTLDGAFFALLEDEPLVEPLWEPVAESAGVAAEAGVSAGASDGVSEAGVSSLEVAFFFLIFFSLSA